MLKEEKKKGNHPITLPPTSKLVMFYLFIILNIILIFSMISMWHFADLTYLGALITDIAAQVVVFFVYASKAKAENTEGGIEYERMMYELMNKKEEPDDVGIDE